MDIKITAQMSTLMRLTVAKRNLFETMKGVKYMYKGQLGPDNVYSGSNVAID